MIFKGSDVVQNGVLYILPERNEYYHRPATSSHLVLISGSCDCEHHKDYAVRAYWNIEEWRSACYNAEEWNSMLEYELSRYKEELNKYKSEECEAGEFCE